MAFTTKKYTTTDNSYETLANTIIDETSAISETEYSESLTKDVASGIRKQLKKKKLKAGEKLTLVDNAAFYLNIVSTASRGNVKKATNNTTSINKLSTTGPHLFFSIAEFKDYKDYAWKKYTIHKSMDELSKERAASSSTTENTKYPLYNFITKKQDNKKLSGPKFIPIEGDNARVCRKYINGIDIYKKYTFTNDTYGVLGSGLKGINGDKFTASSQQNGYIYVFDKEDILKHTFIITKGKYQEILLSEKDCSYRNKKGVASESAKIPNFFEQEKNKDFQKYQFVFSKVKLTKSRLFPEGNPYTPKFTPSKSGRSIPLSKHGLSALGEDSRSGGKILLDYRVDDTTMPNPKTYHLSTKIQKNKGIEVVLHYPDPIKELDRRTKEYKKKLKDRHVWVNEEFRMEQFFLYTSIDTMRKKDSGMKYQINDDFMKEWYKEYQHRLRKLNDAISSASANLIAWLGTPELEQCLFNHISSKGTIAYNKAIEAYGKALIDLEQDIFTGFFYEGELKNDNSFLCVFYNIKNKPLKPNEDFVKKGLLLNSSLFNADEASQATAALRKSQQFVLGLLTSSSPKMLKILGNKAFVKLIDRVATKFLGKVLPKKRIKALNGINESVDIIDTSEIPKSKPFKIAKSFFETINLIYAVKIYTQDSEHRVRNMLVIIGASADMVSENQWLFLMAKKMMYSPVYTFFKSERYFLAPLQLISGIIDCYVGTSSAREAYKNGEIGLATGFSIFAVGGLITAIGAGIVLAGGKVAITGSGTALGASMMVVGIIVEGIGCLVNLWFDNRPVKNWIDASIFGDNPKILELGGFKNFTTNREIINRLLDENVKDKVSSQTKLEIKKLNHLLLGFSVSASFKQFKQGSLPFTAISFELIPKLITENALITFSNITIYMENRISENIYERVLPNYFSDETHDDKREETQEKVEDFVLDLGERGVISNKLEKDSNNKIVLIKGKVIYPKDVDRITGIITLDIRTNSKQVLSIPFNEEASFYE